MRSISIGVPSGKAKMTLWEGTEDEEKFDIKFPRRGIPYVFAYGVKYPLTREEIQELKKLRTITTTKGIHTYEKT